jgi:lipoprotein-anchoring transpeptidase ErfK/SrfK
MKQIGVWTLGMALLAGCASPAPEPAHAMGIAPVEASASEDQLYLVVSISERVVRVFRGDEQIRSYPISVGKEDHPTPTGEFTIHQIDFNPDWTPPDSEWSEDREFKEPGHPDNPMGRVRMIYQRPYSLHGTEATESLGRAESHGSIRVANEDIKELARLVMEAGGEPRPDSWYEEVFADETEMVEVRLPNPVKLVNVE